MHLAEQLYAAGVKVFPCRENKNPAVGKGQDWRDYADRHPSSHPWPSALVGLPVPSGVVVIDLDTYKGITRQSAEQAIGCSLPWDSALIQTTQRGGQHYAFSVNWPVRQGSNINGVTGLDTRMGGKGYICTGGGYNTAGFGPFAFAYPNALPRLPEACRPFFEHVAAEPSERKELPADDVDIDAIRAALAYIDPGCGRTEWVKVGLALRHQFHDDPDAGLTLFDAWSAGELWPDGCPGNYASEVMENQWFSFKPEGDTTIGSLYYEAIKQGWVPPRHLDTASAFGPGAAPSEDFNTLIDRIQEHGSDPKHTNDLTEQVRDLVCNALQRAALAAALQRELKEAGLLTKPVRAQLDTASGVDTQHVAPGMYGKNHTENAQLFLSRCYPDDTLVYSDEVWFRYTGKAWLEMPDATLHHQIAIAMLASLPQDSTTNGTYNMLSKIVYLPGRKIGDTPGHLILYDNGVLDLNTGNLLAHSPDYFTTNILPYSYAPGAPCPNWLAFLNDIFEGDQERIALLQEWFGYMMSASYVHHKIMLLLGRGRSGKGTIGHILEQVVGAQNFTGGSLHAFADDAYLESLRTKPVIFIGDAEKRVGRTVVDQVIGRVKGISAADKVSFKRKYKSSLNEILPSRITAGANSVPNLFDDSGALADRLLVLTFDVSYLGRENLYLLDELMLDIEGISAWSLLGLRRLNGNGRFTIPEASRVEMQYIAETYSPLKQFVDEVCELGGDAVLDSGDVYEAYKAWAIGNQEAHVLNRRPFVSAFKDFTRGRGCRYGIHRTPDKVIRGFKGLAVGRVESMTAGAFKPTVVAT